MFDVRRFAGLASLIVLACARGNVRTGPRLTDPNVRVVAFVWPSINTVPMSGPAWRASPWFRDEDMVTPSRVVIAVDRFACIMRDGDVRDPQPTQPFVCQDQW